MPTHLTLEEKHRKNVKIRHLWDNFLNFNEINYTSLFKLAQVHMIKSCIIKYDKVLRLVHVVVGINKSSQGDLFNCIWQL